MTTETKEALTAIYEIIDHMGDSIKELKLDLKLYFYLQNRREPSE